MSKFVRPAAEGADPFGTARLRRGRARRLGRQSRPLPRGRQRRGGPRPRRLPGPARRRARAERRRRRGPRRGARPAAADPAADGRPRRRQHRRPAGRRRRRVAVHPARLRQARAAHDGAVGRFGVGFAAVLAVTDEPAVVGRHGGVRWSLAEARELAADTARHSPGLGDELRRRDGHVPLLRLPLRRRGHRPRRATTPSSSCRCATPPPPISSSGCWPPSTTRCSSPCPGLDEVVIEIGAGRRADAAAPRRRRRTSVVEDSRDGATPLAYRRRHGGASSPRCSPTGPSRSGCGRTGRSPGPCPSDDDGAPGPAAHRARRARADPQRRAPRRARAAHRLPPAGHHPPPRRARPAHRLPRAARGRRVRRTPRRLARR